ncbi:NfeD family protein [Aerosakkonemataceae cyanobacterium BLCC-F50]|uniref:NfeD family protein n=1 Tax=Floridaenema flaviceps BLCC-F50 TaxID=3153642 RepID=A0ABV4Y0A9_9CYAN
MVNLFVPENVEMFSEALMGTVEKTITQNLPGRVKCLGSYWPARFYHSNCDVIVFPDDFVKVVGRQGITMLVVPVSLGN